GEDNAGYELHRVEAVEDLRLNRPPIAALTAVDDRGIVAEAANVNSDDDDLTKRRLNLPRRRFVGERLGDERDRVDARELPLDADAEEVRVFPVILFPPLDLRLVGDGDLPRVDRGRPDRKSVV